MQELRSTDILDKEIQADARKKAERMLAKADSDCAKLLASVDTDIEKAGAEKEEFFAHKLEAFEKDRMAVVPLEKERFKVSFIQNSVIQNINKYLEGLSEEKRLSLVARNFDFKTELSLNAYVYGFTLPLCMYNRLFNLCKSVFSSKKTVCFHLCLSWLLPPGSAPQTEDEPGWVLRGTQGETEFQYRKDEDPTR